MQIGIIGLGAIGERLIKILADHDRIVIKSIYDIDEERTKYMASTYHLDPVKDYHEMIEDPEIDLIYVAVPPKYHHDIALEVIEKKHILCEKPLAGTIEEAEAMYLASKKYNHVNAMNFPLYYGPAFKTIKRYLADHKLGKILRLELKGYFPIWPRFWQVNKWIDTREEGGFTREVFTHFIQLMQSEFGKIENIHSKAKYLNEEKSEVSLLATAEIGPIDLLFNGLVGVEQVEDLRWSIIGEKGSMELLNWRDLDLVIDDHRESIDLDDYNSTSELFTALCDAVEGKDSPLVSFEDGYHAVRVVETLLK